MQTGRPYCLSLRLVKAAFRRGHVPECLRSTATRAAELNHQQNEAAFTTTSTRKRDSAHVAQPLWLDAATGCRLPVIIRLHSFYSVLPRRARRDDCQGGTLHEPLRRQQFCGRHRAVGVAIVPCLPAVHLLVAGHLDRFTRPSRGRNLLVASFRRRLVDCQQLGRIVADRQRHGGHCERRHGAAYDKP